MAWEGSDRKSRLPRDWARIRAAVMARDGWMCQWVMGDGSKCMEPANQCDHIEPGDNHTMLNLRALCGWHHSRKSANEGVVAKRPAYSRYRPIETHPGLLDGPQ